MTNKLIINKIMILRLEASHHAEAQSVTAKSTGCGFYPQSRT